jgi:hypothetical protein
MKGTRIGLCPDLDQEQNKFPFSKWQAPYQPLYAVEEEAQINYQSNRKNKGLGRKDRKV